MSDDQDSDAHSFHSGEIAAMEGMAGLFGDMSDDDINIDSDSDESDELSFED